MTTLKQGKWNECNWEIVKTKDGVFTLNIAGAEINTDDLDLGVYNKFIDIILFDVTNLNVNISKFLSLFPHLTTLGLRCGLDENVNYNNMFNNMSSSFAQILTPHSLTDSFKEAFTSKFVNWVDENHNIITTSNDVLPDTEYFNPNGTLADEIIVDGGKWGECEWKIVRIYTQGNYPIYIYITVEI